MNHILRASVLRSALDGTSGVSAIGPMYPRYGFVAGVMEGCNRYRLNGYQLGWFSEAGRAYHNGWLSSNWSSNLSKDDGQ